MARDTLTLVGELAVWIALLMSGWSAVISYGGLAIGRDDLLASGRRALYVVAVALSLAVAGLATALVAHDLSYAYVVDHDAIALSAPVALTALWSGAGGAALVAAWLASAAASWIVASAGAERRPAAARFTATVAAMLAAGVAATIAFANPYGRAGWLPADGRGLAPPLGHPVIAVAGLSTVAAYAALAAAIALVGTGLPRRGPWRDMSRPWLLAAWTLLSLGIALTARGAYAHAGSSGLWWHDARMTVAAVAWAAVSIALHGAPARPDRARSAVAEHVAHAGAALAVVALIANAFTTVHAIDLRTGEAARAVSALGSDWQIESQGVSHYAAGGRDVTALSLEIGRGGTPAGLLVARRLVPDAPGDPTDARVEVEPGVRASALGDLRVVLDSAADDVAWIRISVVPVAWLFWLGALLTVVGGAAALGFRSAGADSTRGSDA